MHSVSDSLAEEYLDETVDRPAPISSAAEKRSTISHALFPINPDRLYRISELLGPGRLPISRASFYESWVKDSGLEILKLGPRTSVVKGSSLIAVLAKRIGGEV